MKSQRHPGQPRPDDELIIDDFGGSGLHEHRKVGASPELSSSNSSILVGRGQTDLHSHAVPNIFPPSITINGSATINGDLSVVGDATVSGITNITNANINY